MGWLGSALAQDASAPTLPSRFDRPAPDTDEGGLWAMMDREETRLRRSPLLVRDPRLNDHLRDLVCKLGGDHCQDVRVYVVRMPMFNASMAPNGMMQIWTGLLLRVENEAQLAAVLGHEIAHYLERHTLERLRDLKSRAAFAQFMGMFGLVGAMAQLGTLAGGFAFSREHETRADALGMRLMQRAGYRGQEAATVWDNLIAELRVTGGEDAGRRNPMTATHPPAADRRDELLRLAGDAPGESGEMDWRALVGPYRRQWLMDELRRGQYEESLVLFERMQRRQGGADVLHAHGEVYRLRQSPGDADRALALFRDALTLPDAPVEVHRSMGLVHRSLNQAPAAQAAFERYLELHPQAPDAGLIKTYLEEKTP